MSILDRATKEERARIQAAREAYDEARNVRRRHEQARERLSNQMYQALNSVPQSKVALYEAWAAGGALPVAPVSPPVDALKAALKGADMVLQDARHEEGMAKGALRAAAFETLRACADREAAEKYLLHARGLEASHAELAGAQLFISTHVGDHSADILDVLEFEKLYVPGSRSLASLHGQGHNLDGRGTMSLAGGDRGICAKLAQGAAAELEAALLALCGESIAQGVVGYDVGPVPVARPEPKNTRRAALEAALSKEA